MSESNVLVAHFPRAAMGYAQSAVDEFVRQIGERLEELQIRLDEANEENEKLQKKLAASSSSSSKKAEPEQPGQREIALANAMLAIEQRRLLAEAEIESVREEARTESDSLREKARLEAEGLKEQAKRELESVTETARREAESLRASAQTEANQIVGRAKYAAEQMMDEAAELTAAEEERLQSLRVQFDNSCDEIRRVLEMQLSLLPARSTEASETNAQTSQLPPIQTVSLAEPAEGEAAGEQSGSSEEDGSEPTELAA